MDTNAQSHSDTQDTGAVGTHITIGDPDAMRAAASQLLVRLERWEREGTLDNIERLLKAVNALMDILTPEIVENIVRMLASTMELADKVAYSDVLPIGAMVEDIETVLKSQTATNKHEIRHLWQELHQPDVQRGIDIGLLILKLLGQRTAPGNQGRISV